VLAAGAACVHRNAREPELAGGMINAGSDLLAHTAAEHARRPGQWSPCRMGNCVGPPALPAYTETPASRNSRAGD